MVSFRPLSTLSQIHKWFSCTASPKTFRKTNWESLPQFLAGGKNKLQTKSSSITTFAFKSASFMYVWEMGPYDRYRLRSMGPLEMAGNEWVTRVVSTL